MRTLFYLEPSAARGGIEIFAERHAAALRAAGREVEIAHEMPADLAPFDEIVVHKCTDLATLDEEQAPYTILRTTGGVTGDFPSMGNRWFLKASSDGKDLLLDVIRGTVILFR